MLPLLVLSLITSFSASSTSSSSSYLTHHVAASHRLDRMSRVGAVERQLILELREITRADTSDSDLSYYTSFLLADTRYPWPAPVGATLAASPLERFKVVERYIFDWEMFAEFFDGELHLGLGVEQRLSVAELTESDLVETVVDLNRALRHYGEVVREESYNSGNYLVLTNISHALGDGESCVRWGELADRDLVTSPEPFTIPGEEHWLEFYLAFLECLVWDGTRDDQVKEVREAILSHYVGDKEVKRRLRSLGGGPLPSREDWCSEEVADVETGCHVIRSRDSYLPIRVERPSSPAEGGDFTILRSPVHIREYSGGGEDHGSSVLVVNVSDRVVGVVHGDQGRLLLNSGDGVVMGEAVLRWVCAGDSAVELYSV